MDSLLNLCPRGFDGEHINVSLALLGSNASNAFKSRENLLS